MSLLKESEKLKKANDVTGIFEPESVQFPHFDCVEEVIDNNPDSEYLIITSNINLEDTWIWKFCHAKHNFVPLWSKENCNVKDADLQRAMKRANDWIDYSIKTKPKNRILPIIYLLKVK